MFTTAALDQVQLPHTGERPSIAQFEPKERGMVGQAIAWIRNAEGLEKAVALVTAFFASLTCLMVPLVGWYFLYQGVVEHAVQNNEVELFEKTSQAFTRSHRQEAENYVHQLHGVLKEFRLPGANEARMAEIFGALPKEVRALDATMSNDSAAILAWAHATKTIGGDPLTMLTQPPALDATAELEGRHAEALGAAHRERDMAQARVTELEGKLAAAKMQATAAADDTTDKDRIAELQGELEGVRVQLAATEEKATASAEADREEVAAVRVELEEARAATRAAEARAEELAARPVVALEASELSAAQTRIALLEEEVRVKEAALRRALTTRQGLGADEVAVKRKTHEEMLRRQLPLPRGVTRADVDAALELQRELKAYGLENLSIFGVLGTFDMTGEPEEVVARLREVLGPLQRGQDALLLGAGARRQ